MTRTEFKSKYTDVIATIGDPERDDPDVRTDKLVSSIRGYSGEVYIDGAGEHPFDIYPGIPDDFDWDQAYADYQELIKE